MAAVPPDAPAHPPSESSADAAGSPARRESRRGAKRDSPRAAKREAKQAAKRDSPRAAKRQAKREAKQATKRSSPTTAKGGATPVSASGSPAGTGSKRGQIGLILRCTHPRLALGLAVGTVVAALLVDRPFGQALLAGLAVLLVQMVAGLMNDVFDREIDQRAGRQDKHVATGAVPSGNATFVATALFLIAVPLSLQSGVRAGLILLATLLVAFLHNRSLHRTPASFLGWAVTLPMIGAFVSYADRDTVVAATAPTTAMILVLALLGLCLHLITSLRHLPLDHRAGIKPLPLLVALKIGAPKLMYVTVVLTLVAVVALVMVALGPGLHR